MPDLPRDAVLWREHVDLAPLVERADRGRTDRSPDRADVVVVGAGYAGLAAATALAVAGREVVVLEAGDLGTGAHARNGGMVIPELKAGPAALARRYGPLGERMYREVNDAFDLVERLAGAPGTAAPDDGLGTIDCGYARTGQLYLAHAARVTAHLRATANDHAAHGENVIYLDRAQLADEIGSPAFHGAVRYARTGGLQPAAFHAGLLRRALDAGVTVRDRTRARRIEDLGRRRWVHTDAGAIEAAEVVVATNATADALLPGLSRRVLPIGSFIVATDPLPPALQDELSPRRRMFVDTRNLLAYWRLSPDGRLVFGGRRSLAPTSVADAAAYLRTEIDRIHPQLAATPLTHRWGGDVAMTLDRLPHVGRLGGAWYVTGCNGSGVAGNTGLGHHLGLALADRAPLPAVADLPHRPIPLHRHRRAWLPAVGAWFKTQDHP